MRMSSDEDHVQGPNSICDGAESRQGLSIPDVIDIPGTEPSPRAGVENEEGGEEDVDMLDTIRKHYAANGEDIVLRDVQTQREEESNGNDIPLKTTLVNDTQGLIKVDHRGYRQGQTAEKADLLVKAEGTDYTRESSDSNPENLPGAYAEAGPPTATANSDEEPILSNTEYLNSFDGLQVGEGEQTHHADNNTTIAIAKAVEEGRGDLQHAEAVQEDPMSSDDSNRGKKSLLLSTAGLLLLSALLIGVTLLAILVPVLSKKSEAAVDNDQDGASVAPSVDIASQAPSWKQQIENLFPVKTFPDYTLAALEDTNSPQLRALQWLLDDPSLPTYSEFTWRVQQRFALATLYFATGGDRWTKNEGWLNYTKHECDWWSNSHFFLGGSEREHDMGIFIPNACERNDTDSAITFDANDANTSAYKNIWLFQNNLKGALPEEVALMTSLKSLSMYESQLDGTLSTRLGLLTNLVGLEADLCGLKGSIPTEFGSLTNMYFLYLIDNQLNHTLPSELGKLKNLEEVMLEMNELTGTIPHEVFQATNSMNSLYLYMNMLTGSLPSHIGLLTAAYDFFLDANHLTGTVPSEIGMMSNLTRFSTYYNEMTGSLPTELSQLSNLTCLELQHNKYSGTIPSELGGLQNLTHILLQGNQLTGTIPSEIEAKMRGENNSHPLWVFNVTGNPLTIGNLSSECWVNETFITSGGCADLLPWEMATSCWCDCSCPS